MRAVLSIHIVFVLYSAGMVGQIVYSYVVRLSFACFISYCVICLLLDVQNWHKKYRSFRETVFAFVSGVQAFHANRLWSDMLVDV